MHHTAAAAAAAAAARNNDNFDDDALGQAQRAQIKEETHEAHKAEITRSVSRVGANTTQRSHQPFAHQVAAAVGTLTVAAAAAAALDSAQDGAGTKRVGFRRTATALKDPARRAHRAGVDLEQLQDRRIL